MDEKGLIKCKGAHSNNKTNEAMRQLAREFTFITIKAGFRSSKKFFYEAIFKEHCLLSCQVSCKKQPLRFLCTTTKGVIIT